MAAADDAAPTCGDGVAVFSAVQERAYAQLVPLNASIELTLRCNLRCLHCYNFDRDAAASACGTGTAGAAPELSPDEILSAMRQLHAAGCLFLAFTGGEVFSHPHLFSFMDEARRLGLAVQLLSNGTMLQPGVVGRLAAYPNLVGCSVSLYGATAETHDAITQIPGSFRRTWDGARRLKDKGIETRLKLIGMRGNAHEMEGMIAAAEAGGFSFMIDVAITARHDGPSRSTSLATRVDRAQLETLYRGPLRPYVPKGRNEIGEAAFPCNCARANCAISATGDVYPCVSVPWTAGNIRQQPFADIWRGSPVFQRIRGLRVADYEKCAPCALKPWCTRNRGAAYTATGDYTKPDPFTCEAAEIAQQLNPRPVRAAK